MLIMDRSDLPPVASPQAQTAVPFDDVDAAAGVGT